MVLVFTGSISLTETAGTKPVGVVTVVPWIGSNESRREPACEGCYKEDIGEFIAERELR